MAAKHKTTKKAVKRKAIHRNQAKPVESLIPDQAPTVVPSTSSQPTQEAQPAAFQQPIQPAQTQPDQSAQPMQTVPLSDASQSRSVQEASSFENSMTQPVVGPATAPVGAPTGMPTVASVDSEPEIKIGIENKSASEIEEKPTDLKPDASQAVAEAKQSMSGEKKNLLLPIIFIVLLGVAVLGGLFIYRQNFSNKIEEKINEISLSPTPIQKPTAVPVDLSKYEIEVLNGSGIAGEASNQKNNLEDAGFKVSSIGNADNSDYTETVIQAKKSVDKAFVEKLKTNLAKSFKVTAEVLDEDAETDIVVIIGSTKAK